MSTHMQTEETASLAIHDHYVVRRATVVVLLFGIALIHLLDIKDKFEELPYVGFLFLALIASSLILAEMLVRSDDLTAWLMAGAIAGATILGYAVSRSVGLPGDGGGDIGNWWEGLGLASLLVEACVVVLVAGRLADRRTR